MLLMLRLDVNANFEHRRLSFLLDDSNLRTCYDLIYLFCLQSVSVESAISRMLAS